MSSTSDKFSGSALRNANLTLPCCRMSGMDHLQGDISGNKRREVLARVSLLQQAHAHQLLQDMNRQRALEH